VPNSAALIVGADRDNDDGQAQKEKKEERKEGEVN